MLPAHLALISLLCSCAQAIPPLWRAERSVGVSSLARARGADRQAAELKAPGRGAIRRPRGGARRAVRLTCARDVGDLGCRVPCCGCLAARVSGRWTCMRCVLALVAATCARARAIASVAMGCAWRCVVGRVEPVCSSSLCGGRRARSGDGGARCFEGNLGVT